MIDPPVVAEPAAMLTLPAISPAFPVDRLRSLEDPAAAPVEILT